MDKDKFVRYTQLQSRNLERDIKSRLDQLYNKGKEAGWPKEVMEYLMWWEHETIRLAWRAGEIANIKIENSS